MHTSEDINKIGIKQWDKIEKEFENSAILLGNGFSINFSETLKYRNLYDFFIKDCTDVSRNLFDKFQTRNFEKVLESIEIANAVCDTLKIETIVFEQFQSEIREGLIDSINKIHPRPIDVNYTQIKRVANQFKAFNQIYTTNYDLFLYYLILETHKFGDHMFNQYSSTYNHYGEPDQMNSHHIYYLHGALFLFEEELMTLKIKRPSQGWLLDSITEEISNNNYPLFISEGKSETKMKSIQSNSYLSFCFEQLSKCKNNTLIIYGQSLSEQDSHIIKVIDKNFKSIAISIRPEDWETIGELTAEKNRLSSLFKKADFMFYDSKTLFKFE